MKVDAAAPGEIPVLVALMQDFHAESGYKLDRAGAEASFARLLGDRTNGSAWIARDGDEPTGYIVLAYRHSMEFGGLAACVEDLYVTPASRRQGVGLALVRTLFEACIMAGARAVHVEVAPDNVAARALYRSFGLARVEGREAWSVSLQGETP